MHKFSEKELMSRDVLLVPLLNVISVLELLGRAEGQLLQEMGDSAGVGNLEPEELK